jgi:predicted transcriptional regulator
MKRTTIWLTDAQVKALEKLSSRTGTKIAEIVRRALDEYLKRETKKG